MAVFRKLAIGLVVGLAFVALVLVASGFYV
jgi:hypothetical protein